MIDWRFFDRSPVIVDALRSVGLTADVYLLENLPDGWRFLVTPGNSFGFMDGGFDQVILDRWGIGVQTKVRESIDRWHGGFLPVGQTVTCPLPGSRFLIYAPTMESPRSIRYTPNVYWAMRAAALRVATNRHLMADGEYAVCPGLGTLTGKLTPAAAAMQMAMGLELMTIKPRSWLQALTFLRHIDRAKEVP